jgi:hypothetical protein
MSKEKNLKNKKESNAFEIQFFFLKKVFEFQKQKNFSGAPQRPHQCKHQLKLQKLKPELHL